MSQTLQILFRTLRRRVRLYVIPYGVTKLHGVHGDVHWRLPTQAKEIVVPVLIRFVLLRDGQSDGISSLTTNYGTHYPKIPRIPVKNVTGRNYHHPDGMASTRL